jgi:hypothetical protein
MANNIYGAIGLIGGTAGFLDAIDGAGLSDLDMAVVFVQGFPAYHYILDDDSALTESSPGIISPDSNAGDKRWILQANGSSFPLGAALTVGAYLGPKFTAPDGSEWIASWSTSAFDYTSDYAGTPSEFLTSASLMPGPINGLWYSQASYHAVAYNPTGGGIYCTSSIWGDVTNGYTYYTSTNDGTTWTARTFPNAKSYIMTFIDGIFLGVAASTTTTGIIYGTDGVNWTSVTAISMPLLSDLATDGSANIVLMPPSGTVAQYSTDSGASWTTATITAPGGDQGRIGYGLITYNAGAGLYIAAVGTAGQYQTSPTGATWTLRNTQATFLPYSVSLSTYPRYASNATTTVVVGAHGFFATTTDGLTWANHGIMFDSFGVPPYGTAPSALYYDGTRFVSVWNERIFYSTDGTTWAEGRTKSSLSGSICISSGKLFTSFLVPSKMFVYTDPTDTTPKTVMPASIVNNNPPTYYRIK